MRKFKVTYAMAKELCSYCWRHQYDTLKNVRKEIEEKYGL